MYGRLRNFLKKNNQIRFYSYKKLKFQHTTIVRIVQCSEHVHSAMCACKPQNQRDSSAVVTLFQCF